LRGPVTLFVVALLFVFSQTAFGQCGELIVNGDFESGNSGFTTQHAYSPGNLYPEGTYDVLANPNADHQCFGGTDHTSGSGKQMAVNASVNTGRVVWAQTVNVLTGTKYALSAWVVSHCYGISPANLVFKVNGVQVGSNFIAPTNAFNWAQFTATWYSGPATLATIEIFNQNTAGSGNDFGLDDISFMKIDETAPVVTVASGLSMWPPNHAYHTFTLTQLVSSVTDDCDNAPMVSISAAGSDEAENATGTGDGDTWEDVMIAPDCQSVRLRAERQGGGNGRVYTVYITAKDYSGNSSTVECKIAVQHNTGSAAVDDGVGAGYAIASSCGMPKTIPVTGAPTGFTLAQNFPNPFNPSTEIRFSVAEASKLRLTVLDHLGREVAILADGITAAGNHSVTFQADELPSGMYFYRLETAGRSVTKRMMLMK
jgi:hypothetical protein